MAQISKKLKYNEPIPKNIKNSGVVRVQNYNEVVEDITSIYSQLNNTSSNMELVDLVVTGGSPAGSSSSEIISQSLLIPANTIPGSGLLEVMARRLKDGINFSVDFKMYTNTSVSLSGATLLATFSQSSNAFSQAERTFHIESNTINSIDPLVTSTTDVTTNLYLPIADPFDTSVDNYFLFTLKFASAVPETAIVNFAKCVKYIL